MHQCVELLKKVHFTRRKGGRIVMKRAFRLVLAVAGGFVLMIPLGALFDFMNWPVFHSWGLTHESFLIAWATLSWVSYSP